MAAVVSASGTAALAHTSGYSITKIKPAKTAEQGSHFFLYVTGSSKNPSRIDVFLDHRNCAATAKQEYAQDGTYMSGYSYFPAGTERLSVYFIEPVQGSFTESYTVVSGTITGTRFICAYLTPTGSKQPTRAEGSASVKVTK